MKTTGTQCQGPTWSRCQFNTQSETHNRMLYEKWPKCHFTSALLSSVTKNDINLPAYDQGVVFLPLQVIAIPKKVRCETNHEVQNDTNLNIECDVLATRWSTYLRPKKHWNVSWNSKGPACHPLAVHNGMILRTFHDFQWTFRNG